jgi:putative phosphoribosyl transferase
MIFESRTSAGRLLGEELAKRMYANPHVFALVRGGVPVGYEVAKKLKAPLDVIIVRKLGLPSFPELGFGAIAPEGVIEIDETIVSRYHLHVDDIESVRAAEDREMDRRTQQYGAHSPGNLDGQIAILVDDGIATGITMMAAVKYLKRFLPDKIIVAVPVCPDTGESQFRGLADDFICLDYEEYFGAVGEFYEQFPQVSDREVISLLQAK